MLFKTSPLQYFLAEWLAVDIMMLLKTPPLQYFLAERLAMDIVMSFYSQRVIMPHVATYCFRSISHI